MLISEARRDLEKVSAELALDRRFAGRRQGFNLMSAWSFVIV